MPPAYSRSAGRCNVPVTALHPIKALKLNVRPRKACGHHVIRFMRGYAAISGNVAIPSVMVVGSN